MRICYFGVGYLLCVVVKFVLLFRFDLVGLVGLRVLPITLVGVGGRKLLACGILIAEGWKFGIVSLFLDLAGLFVY